MSDMNLPEVQNQQLATAVTDNAIVLSNIVELATSTVRQIARKNLADALGDQSQAREVVSNAVANRIKEKLGL